jgi:hypothetical protein
MYNIYKGSFIPSARTLATAYITLHCCYMASGPTSRKHSCYVMRYHGNATRYLAMGVSRGFIIPALGSHVTILLSQWHCGLFSSSEYTAEWQTG